MALQNIEQVGEDAFTKGFLNAKFANLVISRLNRINKFNVVLPAGWGSGKIVDSEDGMTLDLTGIAFTGVTLYLIANWDTALVQIPMRVL